MAVQGMKQGGDSKDLAEEHGDSGDAVNDGDTGTPASGGMEQKGGSGERHSEEVAGGGGPRILEQGRRCLLEGIGGVNLGPRMPNLSRGHVRRIPWWRRAAWGL